MVFCPTLIFRTDVVLLKHIIIEEVAGIKLMVASNVLDGEHRPSDTLVRILLEFWVRTVTARIATVLRTLVLRNLGRAHVLDGWVVELAYVDRKLCLPVSVFATIEAIALKLHLQLTPEIRLVITVVNKVLTTILRFALAFDQARSSPDEAHFVATQLAAEAASIGDDPVRVNNDRTTKRLLP